VLKDLAPISAMGEAVMLVIVQPSGPVKSMKELIEYARANPGKLSYGSSGFGSIHHLAFRVEDEEHQLAMRARVAAARVAPTPVIDRFWFKSVYFREPGGVLFELATDGPGFAVDEAPERLGESLVLPPWLEPRRAAIEAALAPLAPAPAS